MVDISLLIYEEEPKSSELIRGDIISVSEVHDDVCSHPRFVLLHVMNIPSKKSKDDFVKDIREKLKEQPLDASGEADLGRKRNWSVSFDLMKNKDLAKILESRRLSLTWGQARKLISKRRLADSDPVLIKDDDL